MAQAADNQRLLREIEFAYSDVTRVPVAALRWDQITLDRTNQRWSELLSFARLLLTDILAEVIKKRPRGVPEAVCMSGYGDAWRCVAGAACRGGQSIFIARGVIV
ncbi:hypothetical protein CCR90_13055 [Rhodovulum sulfidophilum]|nr:hypothetical protein [Rhodovulum sulfidophilum]